ncbi:hypothetical protein ILUMI_04566 [Ignelater luminosus]|uniref:Nucleic-acid-binding protein from transposon X-element n=1 Tax=Ignelater luminosus TaxID=2038154 RepID=A0A8K0GIX4_IGNLU|nr:hypothetical protein ILUMI_04566 [Ignelater luminosus]
MPRLQPFPEGLPFSPRCVNCAEDHYTATCTKSKEQPATCTNCNGGHPANYQGCPKFPKKSTPQKKLKPAMENQRPILEISSSSPPLLTKSFAEAVATPSAHIYTTPQRKQTSREDSPPLFTRMLGILANTRHLSTLQNYWPSP